MNKPTKPFIFPEIKIPGFENKFVDRTIHAESATDLIYEQITVPYTYFNWALFGGELPDCIVTLNHKSRRSLGYFRPEGFKSSEGKILDEIAMNPRIFHEEDLAFVLSIIVHEMAHLWKHHFGKRRATAGYHCKEWGQEMDALGLPPSNTGKPGGRRTGYQMMHYIEKDGAFDKACTRLLDQGFAMIWGFTQQQVIVRKKGKTEQNSKVKRKFTCPVCNANVWGKPETNVICGLDRVQMHKGVKIV